jgi:hypothetical protein
LMQMSHEAYQHIHLIISHELSEKMDRALITEEDARRTLAHCEATGIKLLDRSTGSLIGHLRDGALTYWVCYLPTGQADGTQVWYRLLGIYNHRAAIEEEAGQSGLLSPFDIICLKCNQPLSEQKTYFHYLGFPFSTPLPRCPQCGQVYVSQQFAGGKLCEVEETLEDK